MTYRVKLELIKKDDADDSDTFNYTANGITCRGIYNEYYDNKWITNFSDSAHTSTIKHETIDFDSAGRWNLYLAKIKEYSPSNEAHNFVATVISEEDV